jgi:glycosyltransferase involved in cell wall biosynthesis
MKILRIIYDFADPFVQSDGLSTGPYELTLAQGKLGHTIYVLTGNLNGKNIKAGRFTYKLAENIFVYNLPRALWKFGPFLTSSVFVLPYYFYFRIFKQINLVHSHQQMGVWFLLYKYLFGFLDKIPVAVTNHGVLKSRYKKALQEGQKFDLMTKYFEFPIHTFCESLSVKVADALIAVSENTKEELQKDFNTTRDIKVLENGTNIDKFNKSGEEEDLGFKNEDIKIIYWGRLSKRKNFDVLVRSLTKLEEKYKLAYWGPWYDDLEKEVTEFVKKNKLEHRTRYFGSIPYWNVDKYVRAGDIFVLPSSHEGLPKVVIEALSAGCKVVASGFKLNHKIPDMEYLKEISEEEIARAVKDMASKPSNYNQTREIIKKYYSWDSRVEELEEIYKSISH